MKTTEKIFLSGLLACGIFLTSGCDNFSYESKTESHSSVEVNESGINTSSSYKETKSTTRGAIAFKVNDVNLLKGKTVLNLSITNNGDKDVTLKSMIVSFDAEDDNRKAIRDGSVVFDNLAIKLPAGQEIYENFILEDANAEAYNGNFNVNYHFTNILTDPPVDVEAK